MIPYNLLRPLLFCLPAETAHDLALEFGATHPDLFKNDLPPHQLGQTLFGVNFPNPLGLAAGMDKNAIAIPLWKAMGFGFVELGTITPEPQIGNTRPRMFRLRQDHALINRMGFNNDGANTVAARLSKLKNPGITIGISVGKQVSTSIKYAADDHRRCIEFVYPYVDYIVMNVSSPNTKDLRNLQGKEFIADLMQAGKEDCRRLGIHYELIKPKPLLVKIAPDLTDEQLEDILEAIETTKIDGLVATNTTIGRHGLKSRKAKQEGGASGPLLFRRAQEMAQRARARLPKLPIIGVGGISDDSTALMRRKVADLIQIYTGLVYRGPIVVKEIIAALEAERQRLPV